MPPSDQTSAADSGSEQPTGAAGASHLTPLDGPIRSRKFLVLDIESKDDNTQKAGFTRPFMVGVYDGTHYYPFFDRTRGGDWRRRYFWEGGCVDRAMRFILKKNYRGWHIYAHNAGKFDYLFLLPWLMLHGRDLGFRFNLIPVASAIQVMDVWRGGLPKNNFAKREYIWRFLDSLRLIPISLDKAAKAFETHKHDPRLPEGKLKHDLDLPENDKRWIEYNRIDCLQLYAVLLRFHHYIENVLCGEVGVTAPATSMKLFRRKYLKQPIPRDEATHDFVREGYYGGRVEVYQRDGGALRYFDFNSSYPAVMLEDMPAGGAVEWDGEPSSAMQRSLIGFCKVDVEVPDTIHIPPLPVRADGKPTVGYTPGTEGSPVAKGKLIFPVGRLQGVWEWSELQLAMEMGCEIKRWHQSVWYKPSPIFRQFVTDLYAYRDTSRADYDQGLADVVKRILNACYGKFATKVLRKRIYLWDDPELPDRATPATPGPESLVWYAEQEVDACYIIPQISARVTAMARVRLLRAMLQAMELGGTVYYCDTDSIVTNVVMPTSSELGALKDEYPEQSGKLSGYFLGPKLYLLTDESSGFEKIKAKGLQQRTRENLELLASGKTIYQKRLEKIGTLARAGFQRGPRMITVPRQLHPDHGKRQMDEDGYTRPYKVKMW